ncbi:MAG TPA: histidine kinase [Solirubrobacter sp.]|nr:histidine kinase [Solirubrobacter sp.]
MSARRIIEAADAQRARLSSELHDGAQQQLTGCVINLQLAREKLSAEPDKARRFLDSALEEAQAALDGLRDLVARIHPPILTHLGLRAAVEALASRLPLSVRLDLTDQRLPPAVEASVYAVVAEALSNVISHAQASSAAIRIAVEDGLVIVEARDDGIGGAKPDAGGGLSRLADRVAAFDGELTITNAADAGTIVRASIPSAA